MNFLRISGFISFILLTHCIFSQANAKKDTAEAIPFIRFQYTYLLPGVDFEESFGNTSAVGGAFGYKNASNWLFEIEGNFLFGADVKRKNLLNDIINEQGDVTGSQGELIKLTYDIRGLSFFANAGKVFPLSQKNKNSGILTQAGIGFLQHKIFIDYRDGKVFQLEEDNLKGYDRLHRGVAFKQFIGYQYFGSKNLINFYVGIELQQGFTKNVREYNYDTRQFDTETKLDLLYGLRFGWSFTIRDRETEDFYYY